MLFQRLYIQGKRHIPIGFLVKFCFSKKSPSYFCIDPNFNILLFVIESRKFLVDEDDYSVESIAVLIQQTGIQHRSHASLKVWYASGICNTLTAQKMKFPILDFFSKCDQIRIFLGIWSHLLKKSLIENLISFALTVIRSCTSFNNKSLFYFLFTLLLI